MPLKVIAFSGMTPLVAPHLLDASKAQFAENTKLTRGDLRPYKSLLSVKVLPAGPAPATIHRYPENSSSETDFWMTWTDDVDVIRSPIAEDDWDRLYWSGETTGGQDYPRYTKNDIATTGAPYPSTKRRLGVPAPATAPTFTVSGTATDPQSLNITVIYVCTFVTDVGEEGPISPVSTEATYKIGQTINLALPVAPPADWTGLTNITKKRIYRSNTGTNSTDFQFLTELPLATGTYADTALAETLGEVCPSRTWLPPVTGLRGLTMGANGIAAAFKGSTAHFSEAFLPHAWPSEYRQSLEFPIVAVGALPQGFVFATTGQPYILDGADPSSLQPIKLPLKQACVSKKSLVEMQGAVVYASPDGLVLATNSGASVITQSILSKEEWQAYNPSSIKAWQYDGHYYAYYNTGTASGILVFDLRGNDPSFVQINFAPSVVNCAFFDAKRDALYFCVTNGTNPPEIMKHDASAAPLTYTWRSKLLMSLFPKNLSCAQVEGDFENGAVTFKLYTYNETTRVFDLKFSRFVASRDPFWLPSGYRCTKAYFEIFGSSNVRYVAMGEGLDELKQ